VCAQLRAPFHYQWNAGFPSSESPKSSQEDVILHWRPISEDTQNHRWFSKGRLRQHFKIESVINFRKPNSDKLGPFHVFAEMRSSARSPAKSKAIPVTGISLFVQEKRAEFEASNSDLTKLQVFNGMNQQWAELDHDIKLQYERKADYLRRSEARRATTRKKSDSAESERPPMKGYSIFLRQRHHSLKTEDPGLTLTQRSELIAAEWAGMSKADKRVYINTAKRETRKFRRSSEEEEAGEELQHQNQH
jgi:hypothetical protein